MADHPASTTGTGADGDGDRHYLPAMGLRLLLPLYDSFTRLYRLQGPLVREIDAPPVTSGTPPEWGRVLTTTPK